MTDYQDLLGARLDGKDERSRAFRAPQAEVIHTVSHRHYGPVLRQWVGSCTGHSAAQALNTKPNHQAREPYATDDDAMKFYSWASRNDPWDGWYNLETGREDTGSSCLAAAKAVQNFGHITGYEWCFGYNHFQRALMLSPVVVGTVWLGGMFEPDHRGFLDVSGAVEGGHAYLILGYSKRGDYYTMLNSWGDWGLKGRARIRAKDMRQLLEDDGEAVTYLT